MLQLVNALKMLQAQGIEELPLSLNSFILTKEMDREAHHRLSIIQGYNLHLNPFNCQTLECNSVQISTIWTDNFDKSRGKVRNVVHVRFQSHIFATTEFQDNESDTVPSE